MPYEGKVCIIRKGFSGKLERREILLAMKGKVRFQEFFKRNYAFFIAAFVILAWHTQIGLTMDSTWFSIQLEEKSYMEFLIERYQGWTSRLLIEAGLLFLRTIW